MKDWFDFNNDGKLDSFERSIRSSEDAYNNSKYEINQIVKRLNQLKNKWDKMDG